MDCLSGAWLVALVPAISWVFVNEQAVRSWFWGTAPESKASASPSFDADLLERKPQCLKACVLLTLQSLIVHGVALQVAGC